MSVRPTSTYWHLHSTSDRGALYTGTRQDWHDFWPRPIGFVQWTIAGTPGHPILIDTLRRVSEAVNPSNKTLLEMRKGAITPQGHRKLDAVVEMTGPGAFTDSVLRCKP
jgi:alpha 1,6-mannosyltransferase